MIKTLLENLQLYLLLMLCAFQVNAFADDEASDIESCVRSLDYPSGNSEVEIVELFHAREYDLVAKKIKHNFDQGLGNAKMLGQLAEVAYNLAEIESGNKDPRAIARILIDDGGASDPIGYKHWNIKRRIGPNYWNRKIKSKYGPVLRCSVDFVLIKRPNHSGYMSRKMAILISSNDYLGAVDYMKNHPTIEDYSSPSAYYVRFTERFIGVNDQISAVDFLSEVKAMHGVSAEVEEHWHSIIYRSIEDSSVLTDAAKKDLRRRVEYRIEE